MSLESIFNSIANFFAAIWSVIVEFAMDIWTYEISWGAVLIVILGIALIGFMSGKMEEDAVQKEYDKKEKKFKQTGAGLIEITDDSETKD